MLQLNLMGSLESHCRKMMHDRIHYLLRINQNYLLRFAKVINRYRVPTVIGFPPWTRDPGCNKNSPSSNRITCPPSAAMVVPPPA